MDMSGPMPLSQELDPMSRRLLPMVTVVPYVLLAILTVFTVLLKHSAGGSLLIDLALCAPACYFYAFAVLPWPWRLSGVAAVAVVAGTSQASGVNKASALGLAIYFA